MILAQLNDLQTKIDQTFIDLVTPGEPFALLDFPDHDNIGDSAIYLGETAFFARRGMRASYVCKVDNVDWSALEAAIGGGPIYLHGGGNFGDIWEWFQPFREEVLRRYPGRRVIQLPQTIHYASQGRIDQTARAIEQHRNFVLLVRDQRSYDLATARFQCDVRLCPDMAFNIGQIRRPQPKGELLIHLREDKESSSNHDASAYIGKPGVIFGDWPREGPEFRNRLMRKTALKSKIRRLTLQSKGGENAFRELQYQVFAQARVDRGVELLSSARTVITDRLHGHSLCSLIGVTHCALDNYYGKVAAFMAAWRTEGPGVHVAKSLDEAVETLRAKERLSV